MNLLSKKDSWKKKQYLSKKIKPLTILEGLLCLSFLLGMWLAFEKDDFSFFPLHLMAFLGYGLVFFYSIKHAR